MAGDPSGEVLDVSSYWKRPADFRLRRAFWDDPDPAVRGMLSADRIHFYVRELGMIFPFDEERLKPASYELSLGPRYQIEGKDAVLDETNPTLEIPPNSIAFVSMRERLLIPHYIAGRFNLAIDLIYRGLLLGTGPQVDPGFQGVLSCPLHNISNNWIRIRLGDPFAKIDFIKTTGIAEQSRELLSRVTREDELYEQEKQLVGYAGFGNRLFKKSKLWREPILGYPAGSTRTSSSVAELAKSVKRLRRISFIVGISLTVALLALMAGVIALVMDAFSVNSDLRREHERIRQELAQLTRTQEEVATGHRSLNARLGKLEAQPNNTPTPRE